MSGRCSSAKFFFVFNPELNDFEKVEFSNGSSTQSDSSEKSIDHGK